MSLRRSAQAETASDVEVILGRRHDNGADFWSTPVGRIYFDNPYNTISSLVMLYELGIPKTHEAVAGGLQKILDTCRDDGRIRVAPKAQVYQILYGGGC